MLSYGKGCLLRLDEDKENPPPRWLSASQARDPTAGAVTSGVFRLRGGDRVAARDAALQNKTHIPVCVLFFFLLLADDGLQQTPRSVSRP